MQVRGSLPDGKRATAVRGWNLLRGKPVVSVTGPSARVIRCNAMLELVHLPPLMEVSQGSADIPVALIDGPVNTSLANFEASSISNISPDVGGTCDRSQSRACMHGTLVAGVLSGNRAFGAPAVCPACPLILRCIFDDESPSATSVPSASAEVLACALMAVMDAGAKLVNLSCGIERCSGREESSLRYALDLAARKGVLVMASAGNQGRVGGSCITTHPWVIPVVSLDRLGRVANESNLSASIGRQGLAAPGNDLQSVGSDGSLKSFSGTSAACPLVTGAAALLWSEHRDMTAVQIKDALSGARRPRSIVPPVMNAWGAFEELAARATGRKVA